MEKIRLTCDVHVVCAQPHAGVHDWGADLCIGPSARDDHLGLLHHCIHRSLVLGVCDEERDILRTSFTLFRIFEKDLLDVRYCCKDHQNLYALLGEECMRQQCCIFQCMAWRGTLWGLESKQKGCTPSLLG